MKTLLKPDDDGESHALVDIFSYYEREKLKNTTNDRQNERQVESIGSGMKCIGPLISFNFVHRQYCVVKVQRTLKSQRLIKWNCSSSEYFRFNF